jgi:uridine phosphorylase
MEKNYAQPGEVLYHTGLTKELLEGARYALVPGDPGRVEGLAKALDPKANFSHTTGSSTPGWPVCREHRSW